MLKSKDLNTELKVLDEVIENVKKGQTVDQSVVLVSVLKGVTLLLKMLRDIRTNQVSVMMKEGIELLEKDDNGEAKK
jgi:hypothetical protein